MIDPTSDTHPSQEQPSTLEPWSASEKIPIRTKRGNKRHDDNEAVARFLETARRFCSPEETMTGCRWAFVRDDQEAMSRLKRMLTQNSKQFFVRADGKFTLRRLMKQGIVTFDQ